MNDQIKYVPPQFLGLASLFARSLWLAALLTGALILSSGCGSSSGGKKKDEFFTSGSREADQRATQRMAKDEQLSSANAGDKSDREQVRARKEGEALPDRKLTLYERLGGEKGIAAIVDDFTTRVIQDPRVNWERMGVKRGGLFRRNENQTWTSNAQNVDRLKKHLNQFFALATGGPAQYDGRDMKAVHEGMQIANAEFDAAIGDLKAALDKLQIPTKEQKELLAIVESTRPQVVTDR